MASSKTERFNKAILIAIFDTAIVNHILQFKIQYNHIYKIHKLNCYLLSILMKNKRLEVNSEQIIKLRYIVRVVRFAIIFTQVPFRFHSTALLLFELLRCRSFGGSLNQEIITVLFKYDD